MPLAEAGRLVIHREDNCMVAYFAQPDTMQNAIKIGSIYEACVIDNPKCWTAFVSLMMECTKGLIGKVIRKEPTVIFGEPQLLKEH